MRQMLHIVAGQKIGSALKVINFFLRKFFFKIYGFLLAILWQFLINEISEICV
jgi:hypothetical protein